jgi:hypothetical protein
MDSLQVGQEKRPAATRSRRGIRLVEVAAKRIKRKRPGHAVAGERSQVKPWRLIRSWRAEFAIGTRTKLRRPTVDSSSRRSQIGRAYEDV